MTTDQTQAPITEAEFCARFVAHVLQCAAPYTAFEDGSSIADYAAEVAPTYWASEDQREDGPEACADADMECWE